MIQTIEYNVNDKLFWSSNNGDLEKVPTFREAHFSRFLVDIFFWGRSPCRDRDNQGEFCKTGKLEMTEDFRRVPPVAREQQGRERVCRVPCLRHVLLLVPVEPPVDARRWSLSYMTLIMK